MGSSPIDCMGDTCKFAMVGDLGRIGESLIVASIPSHPGIEASKPAQSCFFPSFAVLENLVPGLIHNYHPLRGKITVVFMPCRDIEEPYNRPERSSDANLCRRSRQRPKKPPFIPACCVT